MKRCGGILDARHSVKEANLRRLQTIRFQLYDALEKTKLWRPLEDQWLPGLVGRKRWIDGAQRMFRALKILCMILLWWIRVTVHVSKLTECTPPRANPKGNRELN